MRLHFHAAMPAAFLAGWLAALSAHASANESDAASAVRGSLGASLDDLSTSAGATVFLLNAGFLLAFAALCMAVRRADSRKPKHLAFRARSRFAR